MEKWTEQRIFSVLVQIINDQFGTELTPTTNLRFSTYYGATKKDMSCIFKSISGFFNIKISAQESKKIITVGDINDLIKKKVTENNQFLRWQPWREIQYCINAPRIPQNKFDTADTRIERLLNYGPAAYSPYDYEALSANLKISQIISYANWKSK